MLQKDVYNKYIMSKMELENIKNVFFTMAVSKAMRMAGKKRRLFLLLVELGMKLRSIEWKHINADAFKTRILMFGRLVKAYALGEYREVSWKNLLLILAVIIYFVNPFDLIPDIIPAIGLSDDVGVLAWAYNSVRTELDKFSDWEASKNT